MRNGFLALTGAAGVSMLGVSFGLGYAAPGTPMRPNAYVELTDGGPAALVELSDGFAEIEIDD